MTIFTLFSSYDSNAPLPTPPTDFHVGDTAPLPEVDSKPSDQDYLPERHSVPNESGIELEDMSNQTQDTKNDLHEPKKVESVVAIKETDV